MKDIVHTVEATYLLGAEIEQPGISRIVGREFPVQELRVSLALSGDFEITDGLAIDAARAEPNH